MTGRGLGSGRHGLLVLAIGVVGLAGSVIAGTAAPVQAHHDSPNPTWWCSSYAHICDRTPLSQCVANNTLHLYQFVAGLSAARRNASERGLTLYSDNSEVSAVEVTSDPDVVVTQANRPDVNAFAWGQCAPQPAPPLPDPLQYGGSNAAHTRWCRPQWIYWNTWSAAANKVNTTARYNYVGCHEVGHTLGLRHRSATSCMITASSGPSDPNSVVPSTQSPANPVDYDRLDNHYPL